jgi:hypothetical protein
MGMTDHARDTIRDMRHQLTQLHGPGLRNLYNPVTKELNHQALKSTLYGTRETPFPSYTKYFFDD